MSGSGLELMSVDDDDNVTLKESDSSDDSSTSDDETLDEDSSLASEKETPDKKEEGKDDSMDDRAAAMEEAGTPMESSSTESVMQAENVPLDKSKFPELVHVLPVAMVISEFIWTVLLSSIEFPASFRAPTPVRVTSVEAVGIDTVRPVLPASLTKVVVAVPAA